MDKKALTEWIDVALVDPIGAEKYALIPHLSIRGEMNPCEMIKYLHDTIPSDKWNIDIFKDELYGVSRDIKVNVGYYDPIYIILDLYRHIAIAMSKLTLEDRRNMTLETEPLWITMTKQTFKVEYAKILCMF